MEVRAVAEKQKQTSASAKRQHRDTSLTVWLQGPRGNEEAGVAPKLRLCPDRVVEQLRGIGLGLRLEEGEPIWGGSRGEKEASVLLLAV